MFFKELTSGIFSGRLDLREERISEIGATDPALSLSIPAVPCDMIETTSSDNPLAINSVICGSLISTNSS